MDAASQRETRFVPMIKRVTNDAATIPRSTQLSMNVSRGPKS